MGYSCRKEAANTLDAIQQECIHQTGTQNLYVRRGKKYFFVTSRKEHSDGRITGKVIQFDTTKPVGSFCISPDGTIDRWSHSPVNWSHPLERFEELKKVLFNGKMFVVNDDSPEQQEYDRLYPVAMKFRGW